MEGENAQGIDQIKRLAAPLNEATMWMKLVGVLAIIYGLLGVISIIGIVVAWLPIWMGLLLFQSASRAQTAYASGDEAALIDSLGKIRTYFTITGVITMLGLLLMIAMLFFGVLGLLAGAMAAAPL